MRDFNNYSNQKPNIDGDTMNVIKNFAGKYEGASEDRLISEIIKEAEKGRKNGTLTDADIDRFKNTLSPMLNAEQRSKLNKIIQKLKNN